LFVDYAKNYTTSFTKSRGKLAHRPRKKPLDFGGNPDHLYFGVMVGVGSGGGMAILEMVRYVSLSIGVPLYSV